MIQTLEPIIRGHSFFQGFEERHLQLIVGCAKNVRFEQGRVLFREGEEANEFFLLRDGLVSLEVIVPHRGAVTLQTVGPDDVLGWSWLFPPYRWHFQARALHPTRALAFDGKCLRDKCEDDHDLGYELLKRFSRILIERLKATRLQLLDFYGASA